MMMKANKTSTILITMVQKMLNINEMITTKKSDKEYDNEKQENTKHGKTVDAAEISHLNLDRETEASKYGKTEPPRNHKVMNEEMVAFDNRTVKSLQNIHFQSKLFKFILVEFQVLIKNADMNRNMNLHHFLNGSFQRPITLKTLIF